MLPRSQRQRAHALAARWLEERLGDRVEEVVEVLAEHLRMAGDDAKAATYLHRAANKARRLYANADAVRLFDQAMEAAKKAGLDHQLPLLRRDRGEVHQLMGAYAAALADFEAGLAAARQAGDRWLEAVLENRIGFVHHREARLDQAEAHFRRAASLAREIGDRQVLGATLIDLATVAWDRGEMPSVDQILAEGIGLLKDTEDRSNLARAHNLRSMAHLAMGNMEQAITAAQDALATAREAGDRSREATSLSYLGVLHSWLARLVPARDYFRSAIEIAEAIGDRRRASYVKEFMVIVDIFAGDWGDGIRRTEELLPEAAELTPLELPYVHLFLGDLYFEVGDRDRALRSYRTCASFTTSPWRMITALARLNATRIQGDRAATGRALDEILLLPTGVFNPNEIQLLGPLADALLEMDRADDLRRLIEARRPAVERFNASWVFGVVALIEARLAAHDGDRHTAAVKLDEALRLSESEPNAVGLRRVLEARAEFFNRAEDRAALRRLCERIAAGLPDDLRTIFLNSPRVAPIIGAPA
jgi:tetratricopeptide (TPR) repeat protein